MKLKRILVSIVLSLILIGFTQNFVFGAISPSTYNPNSSNNSSIISPKTYSDSDSSTEINPISSNIIAIVVACVLGIALYVIPMFIALKRKHPQRFPIACLNVFLGWTFLGWVVCLVWSLSNTKTEQQNSSNKYEDLARIQKLKENGTINEKEFETEKEKILSK